MSNIKYYTLLATIIVCTLITLVNTGTNFSQVEERFTSVDDKLIEIDGRRNAQYGIIKRKIEDRCE